jgi:hypothetical protein
VNNANQDIARDGEEGESPRKQQQGERVAAAAAALRGAGHGGRPRTAAPGRGGKQGLGVHQVPQPAEPRELPWILADDKLKSVFGKEKVTMFEMNKHLTRHLS